MAKITPRIDFTDVLDTIRSENSQVIINDDAEQVTTRNLITSESDSVKAELTRQTAGSLYALLDGAVGADIGWLDGENETRKQAIIDQIKTEIVRTGAGSLYRGLVDYFWAQLNATNGKIDTRATPADVTSARDSIKGGWSIDGARVDLTNSLNTVRDTINAHISSEVAAKSHVTAIRHYRVNATTDGGGNVYVPVTAPANTLKADIRINPIDVSAGNTNTWHPAWSDPGTVRFTSHFNESVIACRLSFSVIEYV